VRARLTRLLLCAAVGLVAACASNDERPAREEHPGTPAAPAGDSPAVGAEREFAEMLAGAGVRVDRARRTVEFDGVVAADCHHPETPDVYLEVVCCTPDTREHEALVVARVAPSLVHAALLLLGAEPGGPGGWRSEGNAIVPVPPTGDTVDVAIVTRAADGGETEHDPAAWIRQASSGRTLREAEPECAWVFAGSRIRSLGGREVYDADGTGQLVGLHTFGSETIAWTRVESPQAAVDEPQWLARNDAVPAMGTPVTVRLRPRTAHGR
jgi:hypothetical protein